MNSATGPPREPYFLRAMHAWINDCGFIPQIIVDAEGKGVKVPAAFIRDGRIVLNVSPSAVRDLVIDNDAISFSARFGGIVNQVFVPMTAILGIYARESGEGLAFIEGGKSPPTSPEGGENPVSGPRLRVVK